MRPSGYSAVLLRAGENELRHRLGLQVMPYKLEFFTTFACQGRCRTCNIWSRYLEAPDDRLGELSPEDIVRTVESAKEHVRWISLTGGEVTERRDFIDIVRGIMDTVGDRLGLLNVITNGLLPERTEKVFKEVARLTRGVRTIVNVSLEPTDELYEKVRGVPGGRTLAMRSLKSLEGISAREGHFKCGCLITLSDLNAPVVNESGLNRIRDAKMMTVGVVTDAFLLTQRMGGVDVERSTPELVAAVERIRSEYPLRGPLDLPPKVFLGLMSRFLRTGRSPIPCVAGEDVLTIDPYGNVLQCFHQGKPLSRLRDNDFDIPSIVSSSAYLEALAPTRGCRECWQACEAYPSMFRNPAGTVKEYAKAILDRHLGPFRPGGGVSNPVLGGKES